MCLAKTTYRRQFFALLPPFCLCLLLYCTGLLEPWSQNTMDMFFALRGVRQAPPPVVLIGIDEKSLDRLGPWPFPRPLHARLLERLKLARAIGFDLLFHDSTANDERFAEVLDATKVPVTLAVVDSYEDKLLHPSPDFSSAVRLGYIETITDKNGVVRRIQLCRGDLPSFAASVTGLQCAHQAASAEKRLINFYGPAFTFLSLSYADVLDGVFPDDFFLDRYVLVGAQAAALGDVHRTPLTDRFALPGVEVQATIVANLIDQNLLTPLPQLQFIAWLLTGFLVMRIWPVGREGRNSLLLGMLLLLLWGTGWLALCTDAAFDPVPAGFFLLLAYPTHLLHQWLRTTLHLVGEISHLQHLLEASLAQSYANLPAVLQKTQQSGTTRLRLQSGLYSHLRTMRHSIDTLALQNTIIARLLTHDTPPLALWDTASAKPLLVNDKFRETWQQLTGFAATPKLSEFLDFLFTKQLSRSASPNKHQTAKASLDIDTTIDIKVTCSDGNRYLRIALHPIPPPSLGNPALLASFTDVTELLELERMRAEVMNIVSHELKLPLTTITGYAEMLSDNSDGARKEWSEKILAQASRLSAMIEEFLSISRIESGRYSIYALPFNPLDTIQDCLSVISHAAEQKALAIRTNLPQQGTPIIGDESLMVQVFLNILDNAVKFSPAGGEIEVSWTEGATNHCLRVGDHGPGVPEGERQLVFEKFVRGKNSTGESKGFGLGLSFVRQVVEAHGGTVAIAANSPHGCMVEIILPKAGQNSAEVQ